MRVNRLAPLLLLLLLTSQVQALTPAPDQAALQASLRKLQERSLRWRDDLKKVKAEDLTINYAEGKLIEQQRDFALECVHKTIQLSTQVGPTSRLRAEIGLLVTLEMLKSAMNDLNKSLLDVDTADAKSQEKVKEWSTKFGASAVDGPMNEFILSMIDYLDAHADEVEAAGCPPAK